MDPCGSYHMPKSLQCYGLVSFLVYLTDSSVYEQWERFVPSARYTKHVFAAIQTNLINV
jgi:hypothetical protein